MNDFLFIYFFVLIAVYTLGAKSQKNGKFRVFPFFLSYLIPWFFICFSNNGPDYQTYLDLVNMMDWDNFSESYKSEPGFNLIIVCLKEISGQRPHTTMFFLKTISILLFALSVYILRDKIDVKISNLFYAVFYFLPAFYLLSMYVAVGIVLCSISIYIKYKKPLFPMLLVVIAAQIHNSAYLLLPIFVLVYSKYASRFANQPVIKHGLLILSFVIVSASTYLFSEALSYSSVFSHFEGYVGQGTSGTGIYIYMMYIIQFAIVAIIQKNNKKTEIPNTLFLFTLFDFVFALASLQFRAIDRMNFYFLSSYLLLYPLLLYKSTNKRVVITQSVKLLLSLYTIIQGYYVYYGRTSALGMDSYHFFNPFFQ